RTLFEEVRAQAQRIRLAKDGSSDLPAPPFFFVTGGAGVGKSFTVYVLRNMIQRELGLTCGLGCMVTATTGTAAHGINGSTIHSSLHLPLTAGTFQSMEPLSRDKLEEVRQEWLGVEFLVVDEISMAGYYTLVAIHKRSQQIRGSEAMFGGCNVLAVGDLMQLPAVQQAAVYSVIRGSGLTSLGTHLWRDLFSLRELNEVMRQKGDSQFATALNRLRIGAQTPDDMALFRSRVVTEAPTDCLRLFRTNAACESFNNRMMDRIRGTLYEVTA
ncbi:hypothetical protein FOZ62_015202, partial [Perkinsus olseni]